MPLRGETAELPEPLPRTWKPFLREGQDRSTHLRR